MPTVGYDFSDAGDFADFVTLEPGNYVFKFSNADASQKSSAGNKKVIIDLIVTEASPANRWAIGGLVRQHWNTSGASSGRFRDFLTALGHNLKEKGTLKLEKYYEEEIGARVIKTPGQKPDAEGNLVYFNDLRQLMPGDQMREILGAAAADEDTGEEDIEDDDEVEEEEDEEEDDVEEAEDDEDEEEEEDAEEEEEDEDDEEYLTLDDLKTMKLPDLIELAKENDISTRAPKGKKLTVGVMRKRLEALFEEEEEEGEEDPF